MLGKEVGKVLHGIRSQARNIFILFGMHIAQCLNAIHHVIGDFDANLHADGIAIGKELTQFNEKSTIAAANVGEFNDSFGRTFILIIGLIDVWIQFGPVIIAGMRRAVVDKKSCIWRLHVLFFLNKTDDLLVETMICDWIGMGPLAIETLLGQRHGKRTHRQRARGCQWAGGEWDLALGGSGSAIVSKQSRF